MDKNLTLIETLQDVVGFGCKLIIERGSGIETFNVVIEHPESESSFTSTVKEDHIDEAYLIEVINFNLSKVI